MATPHFTDAELACRCGCGMLPAPDFIEKIEALRLLAGFPLIVTSAARCAAHNRAVSETGDSGPHTTGRAIDISVQGAQAYRLAQLALAVGITGIGVKQMGAGRYLHLDDLQDSATSPRPRLWSY